MFFFPLAAQLDDIGRRHANVIRWAMQRAYGSLKVGCAEIGTNQANFAHALEAERGLPVGFLNKPSAAFLAWYGIGLVQEFGIPEDVKVAGRVVFGLIGMKRMARMARKQVA